MLRDVEAGDVGAYLRMRCDPAMMADLGGPLPEDQMAGQVLRDMELVAAGTAWIKMIMLDPAVVAGTVTLWASESGESEIGWMVLPEFQGRGLAKQAVTEVLKRARDDGRWGVINAYPATTNVSSNALCRSVGFTLLREREMPFAGQVIRTNHWAA